MTNNLSVATKNDSSTRLPHVVIEFAGNAVKNSNTTLDVIKKGNNAYKIYKGLEAYRRYNWILNEPTANTVGNMRGMVISAKARSAYDIVLKNSKVIDQVGKALFFASVAVEIAKSIDSAEITGNNFENAQQAILIPSMAILSVFGSFIPAGVHLVAKSMEMTCSLTSTGCSMIPNVSTLDYVVDSSYKTIMNPTVVKHYINTKMTF